MGGVKGSHDFADFGDFVQPPPLASSTGSSVLSGGPRPTPNLLPVMLPTGPFSSNQPDLEDDEWSLPMSNSAQSIVTPATATVNSSTSLPYLSASPPPPDYTASEPPIMASSPPPPVVMTFRKFAAATPAVDLGLDEDFELPSDQLQLSDQVRRTLAHRHNLEAVLWIRIQV